MRIVDCRPSRQFPATLSLVPVAPVPPTAYVSVAKRSAASKATRRGALVTCYPTLCTLSLGAKTLAGKQWTLAAALDVVPLSHDVPAARVEVQGESWRQTPTNSAAEAKNPARVTHRGKEQPQRFGHPRQQRLAGAPSRSTATRRALLLRVPSRQQLRLPASVSAACHQAVTCTWPGTTTAHRALATRCSDCG